MVHTLAIETPPWLQTERAVAAKERAIDRVWMNMWIRDMGPGTVPWPAAKKEE
jgi:hypothetical protein